MGKQNTISSIIWLCISTAFLIGSVRLGIGTFDNPGPGFLAFWAAALLFLFSGALLLTDISHKAGSPSLCDPWRNRKWSMPLLAAAAMLIYCLALPILGYIVATAVLTAMLFASGGLRTRLAVPGAMITTLLTFILFDRLLKMPLPRGLFGF